MKRLILLSGLCTLMALWSCNAGRNGGQDHEHSHDHDIHTEEEHRGTGHSEEEHAAEAGHTDEIVISPEKAAAAGIATETVIPGPFSGVIRTGGQILPAINDEKTLVATTDGIISFSGNYLEGTSVSKSQPVFSILSGNIQDGNRVGKAKVAYETAKAEYERASRLVDDKIVSQKEFARIREAYENSRMAYEALKPNADGTGVQVEAPFDGFIRTLSVKEGDFVAMGTPVATVTRNRKMLLKADVSQRYYGKLDEITSAKFVTQYGGRATDIRDLGGRLVSVGRSTSDSSYYIPVTFEFDNNGSVVPGSFAEVWLLTGRRDNVLSVPVSALTEEQGIHFVYLKLDGSCYRKQEVTLGESDGARTEILSGLEPGDNVVTEGAYNVKLASASNVIPAHTHNH